MKKVEVQPAVTQAECRQFSQTRDGGKNTDALTDVRTLVSLGDDRAYSLQFYLSKIKILSV
jgi:hypothetical protein